PSSKPAWASSSATCKNPSIGAMLRIRCRESSLCPSRSRSQFFDVRFLPKTMPTVRLAGTVRGENDPNREIRARLLFQLFSNGWNIYNSNGVQRISQSNIERTIHESEAFVFTPGATLEDHFKAISIFVGYQTLDRHLAGKPTMILNSDGSWDDAFALLTHLNR